MDDLIEGNSVQGPLICERCNGEILIGGIAGWRTYNVNRDSFLKNWKPLRAKSDVKEPD